MEGPVGQRAQVVRSENPNITWSVATINKHAWPVPTVKKLWSAGTITCTYSTNISTST